jgi:hypothetical protein
MESVCHQDNSLASRTKTVDHGILKHAFANMGVERT